MDIVIKKRKRNYNEKKSISKVFDKWAFGVREGVLNSHFPNKFSFSQAFPIMAVNLQKCGSKIKDIKY